MFKQEDLLLLKGLEKILNEATFPLKKREVAAFVAIMKWVEDLEENIKKAEDKSRIKNKKKGLKK